jgi:hypothetical protein
MLLLLPHLCIRLIDAHRLQDSYVGRRGYFRMNYGSPSDLVCESKSNCAKNICPVLHNEAVAVQGRGR